MKPLHVGIRGVDTAWLQRMLLDLGYDVEASEDASREEATEDVGVPASFRLGSTDPITQGGNHIAEGAVK